MMEKGLRICFALQKWDYEQHKYLPYFVPTDWKISLFSQDMDELINCCQCGEEIKFGDTYTSNEIHTDLGLGYCVCEKCHEAEMIRKYREVKNEEENREENT